MISWRHAQGLPLCAALLVGLFAAGTARAEDPSLVTIPVDFEINGRPAGEVVVRAQPDLSAPDIQGSSLKIAVRDALAPTAEQAILALSEDFIPMVEIQALGIDISLDLGRLVVVLKAAEKVRTKAPGRGSFKMNGDPNLNPELREPEAAVSFFTNFHIQKTLLAREGGETKSTPLSADMRHVLNVHGWALTVDSLFSSRKNPWGSNWTVRDITVTRDDPKRALRWEFGDLSSPITLLQTGNRIGGVSLSRDFTLQPYDNFQPTGTAAFNLLEAATVEVYLNGTRIRTLQLDAGTYNLEDFNLAAGANDMGLRITTASGRSEEIDLTLFTSRSLLGRGVSEFALSAGFPVATPGSGSFPVFNEPWLKKHYENNPIMSGFYRHGFTDTLTAETHLQGASYWQRFGGGVNLATPIGAFDLNSAFNRNSNTPSGYSLSAAWEHAVKSTSIRFSSTYTSADFIQTRPDPVDPGRLAWSQSLTITRPLPFGVDHTTSAFYQTAHDSGNAWGGVVRLSRRVGSFNFSFSLQARKLLQGARETGGFFRVSWAPRDSSFAVRTVAGFGNGSVNPGFLTDVNYSGRTGNRYYYANVGIEDNDAGRNYTGSLRYQDNSMSAEVTHRQVYNDIFGQNQNRQETVGKFDFAFAFADGAFGITRQVEEGFVIVQTHPRWRDVKLGINPAFGGFEHTVGSPVNTAVLSRLHAYRESTAFIQTVASDRTLEINDYYFFPSNKRGTRLVIGSDAIYTLRGTLLTSEGDPVAYKTITLSKKGADPLQGFTNRAGRFVVGPLSEGTWRIDCSFPRESTEVEIGGEETFIRMGEIHLEPVD